MKIGRREFVAGAASVALAKRSYGQGRVRIVVTDEGAVGDAKTKNTLALQHAIDKCSAAGGGDVVVPEGVYFTGALELRSHVMLRLERGAMLHGTLDLADYRIGKVRWEGKWIDGYLGLIFARHATDFGISGEGSVAGGFGLGGRPTQEQPLRRPCLIEPIDCKRVTLEGFYSEYSRMWSLHPTYCEDVTIKGLSIRSTYGNGDGIDVDSCKRVKIDACDIATGDDCISVKSGRGMEGFTLARPSEDVEITNCTFADSLFACIGIGSETSGGVRNVRVSKCQFKGAKTFAVYIKSRPGRGAYVDDISVSDCDVVGEYGGGFLRFNMTGSGLQDENPVTGTEAIPRIARWSFRDIRVENVPVLVDGSAINAEQPLDGLVLENISGRCAKGVMLSHVRHAAISGLKVTVAPGGELLQLADVSGMVDGKAVRAL